MIAEYSVSTANEEFCCDDERCERYVRKGQHYVIFTNIILDNGGTEIIITKECLECAHEKIENDMEERAMVLSRVEHSL